MCKPNTFGVMLVKNSRSCPKCASFNILKIPGKHTGYGAGNIILVGLTALNAVKVARFLCEQCGYSEEWIESEEDIRRLKAKYK
jgi:predicted nucleic-acid-binding Zn-ribbon protein